MSLNSKTDFVKVSILNETSSLITLQGSKKDLTLEDDAEAVQERFSVNDIEHWTSTVVSVLNMLV